MVLTSLSWSLAWRNPHFAEGVYTPLQEYAESLILGLCSRRLDFHPYNFSLKSFIYFIYLGRIYFYNNIQNIFHIFAVASNNTINSKKSTKTFYSFIIYSTSCHSMTLYSIKIFGVNHYVCGQCGWYCTVQSKFLLNSRFKLLISEMV